MLRGLAHVRQSVEVIFTTRFRSRVMRRSFGSAIPVLLGRSNLNPTELLRFYTAIHIALTLWEPRLRSLRAFYPADQNTPEKARQGRMGLRLRVKYLPNALQGDITSDAVDIDL